MTNTNMQIRDYEYVVEEKGNLEHAIRCAEQAEKRADSPWLKEACSFRVKILRERLARQREH